MNQDLSQSGMSPAGSTSTFGEEEKPSKWPTVIGVLSLIYGIGGLLCQGVINGWVLLANILPEQFRGGITFPPVMRIMSVVQLVILAGLGILMIMGSVALLSRRRIGVKRLKTWVVGRIVMIVIGVVLTILTLPAQVEMQRQSIEWQRDFFKEHNIDQAVPDLTDQQIVQRVMIGTVIMTCLVAVYPVVLGLYLSRPKVTAESQNWP